MKFTILFFSFASFFALSACNNTTPSSNVTKDTNAVNAVAQASIEETTSSDPKGDSSSVMNAIAYIRSKHLPLDAQRDQNIWDYEFQIDQLAYQSNDQWFLHKAYDATTSTVCLVLAIKSTRGVANYYRGNVHCPDICGADYSNGGGLDATVLHSDLTLTGINGIDAEGLISNQVDNLVYTIPIYGNVVSYMKKTTNAKYFHAVFGSPDPVTPPNIVYFYAVDANGKAIGAPFKCAGTLLCVKLPGSECGL